MTDKTIIHTVTCDFPETVPSQTVIIVQIIDGDDIRTAFFTPEEFEEYRKR